MSRPLIIDGNSLVMRNIKVTEFDDLKANGTFTGGVYGSLRMLTTLVDLYDLDVGSIFMFFDAGVPSKRLELIPGYKSKRKEAKSLLTDEEAKRSYAQLGLAKDMFRLLGVVCESYANCEADDCVAAAARVLEPQSPIVVSGDKDMWQVVGYGDIEVWDLNKKILINHDNFIDVVMASEHIPVGVPIGSWLTYRTLVGDTSDSIKGAAGCGAKRASKIVNALTKYCGDVTLADIKRTLLEIADSGDTLLKYEQAVIDDFDRLVNVREGIDLLDSFMKDYELSNLLRERPIVDKMAFLRFCTEYSFGTVLACPDRFIDPYTKAANRRLK